MKGRLSKICLILAVIFTCHAATAVACLNCQSFQIDTSMNTHCEDKDQAGDEQSTENKLDCCCFDNPIKNADALKMSADIFYSVNIAVLDFEANLTEKIIAISHLNLSLKRYRPFSPLNSANPLAVKQSFLI